MLRGFGFTRFRVFVLRFLFGICEVWGLSGFMRFRGFGFLMRFGGFGFNSLRAFRASRFKVVIVGVGFQGAGPSV